MLRIRLHILVMIGLICTLVSCSNNQNHHIKVPVYLLFEPSEDINENVITKEGNNWRIETSDSLFSHTVKTIDCDYISLLIPTAFTATEKPQNGIFIFDSNNKERFSIILDTIDIEGNDVPKDKLLQNTLSFFTNLCYTDSLCHLINRKGRFLKFKEEHFFVTQQFEIEKEKKRLHTLTYLQHYQDSIQVLMFYYNWNEHPILQHKQILFAEILNSAKINQEGLLPSLVDYEDMLPIQYE